VVRFEFVERDRPAAVAVTVDKGLEQHLGLIGADQRSRRAGSKRRRGLLGRAPRSAVASHDHGSDLATVEELRQADRSVAITVEGIEYRPQIGRRSDGARRQRIERQRRRGDRAGGDGLEVALDHRPGLRGRCVGQIRIDELAQHRTRAAALRAGPRHEGLLDRVRQPHFEGLGLLGRSRSVHCFARANARTGRASAAD